TPTASNAAITARPISVMRGSSFNPVSGSLLLMVCSTRQSPIRLQRHLHDVVECAGQLVAHLHQGTERNAGFLALDHRAHQVVALPAVDGCHELAGAMLLRIHRAYRIVEGGGETTLARLPGERLRRLDRRSFTEVLHLLHAAQQVLLYLANRVHPLLLLDGNLHALLTHGVKAVAQCARGHAEAFGGLGLVPAETADGVDHMLVLGPFAARAQGGLAAFERLRLQTGG